MQRGAEHRRVAATQLNDQSSRSHSIFTAIVEVLFRSLETPVNDQWPSMTSWTAATDYTYVLQVNTTTDRGVVERRTSRLTLVDLAGAGLPLLQCPAAMEALTLERSSILGLHTRSTYSWNCSGARCSHALHLTMSARACCCRLCRQRAGEDERRRGGAAA